MKKIILEAVGEVKDLWLEWREDILGCEEEWLDFCREIGAVRYYSFPFSYPVNFDFGNNPVPDGWIKDKGRGSHPKKSNKAAIAKLDLLRKPKQTSIELAIKTRLPISYRYEKLSDKTYGSSSFSSSYSVWSPHWSNDSFFLQANSDPRDDIADLESKGYAVSFYPVNAEIWPEGYIERSVAERDLVFARDQVEKEKGLKGV